MLNSQTMTFLSQKSLNANVVISKYLTMTNGIVCSSVKKYCPIVVSTVISLLMSVAHAMLKSVEHVIMPPDKSAC